VPAGLLLSSGADGCVIPLFAAFTTGFVEVAGALASDWTFICVRRLFSPLDISYVFGACSACEFLALMTLFDAERLNHKVDYSDN